ncbi:MAG TPA: molybdopterin-dependent oxidoreductase [Stellaceae bacterium]|nr:molybdopterin-dependent oxidoreductase [Stellaceae bacterium]
MTGLGKPDQRVLAAEAPRVRGLERRLFMKQGLSLGALTLLTGCDITDTETVQRVLWTMSSWNDRVQAALFSSTRLAPTYPESAVDREFRFNAFYGEDEAPALDGASFKLELSGLIADKRPWKLEQLYQLPEESQITRHVCVEGWSRIGKWSGCPLRVFLERVGADTTAKYVGFICADGYYSSMDMATALHPQTLMAFKFADQTLPRKFGFPMKIRVPTKLGFKNPKHVVALSVTNDYPGGFWEDYGYNWFGGI